MHERRWQARPDSSGFVTEPGKAFERAALRTLAELGVPRIIFQTIGRSADRLLLHFRARGQHAHKLALDSALSRHSPGVLNVLDTLALASEEGITRVEFLGGAERYKVELADRFL